MIVLFVQTGINEYTLLRTSFATKKCSYNATTEVELIITPQAKSQRINVSGHKKYILWLRGSSVSIINATTVTSSSATIKQLFKSTTVLSTVNAYAIYEVDSSTTDSIALIVSGQATEQMVIGL